MFRLQLLAFLSGAFLGPCLVGNGAATWPQDLPTIRARVAEMRRQLGNSAGQPEKPDTFQSIPATNIPWLDRSEARASWLKLEAEVARQRWWRVGLDPATLTHPLRQPAGVISGVIHAQRAGVTDRATAMKLAGPAAEFLLWAQTQAGTGGFPFPAYRGGSADPALAAAARFLERAERAGRLTQVVHSGWIIEDDSDGGLQFDNGEAGVALFELFSLSGDTNHLAAARRAADWALGRALVPNWNYNSFSVHLLTQAFTATGEPKYLAAAIQKARLGMIPGQLTDGPRAGRWLDPHNARPSYHYIMLRALAGLAAAIPAHDPAREEIIGALKLGLRARNPDFLGPGAPNEDHALETLLLVRRNFANDSELLRETRTPTALTALGRLVSEQARRGRMPLGPRAWGMFLAHAASSSQP